jgi:hypothetical protein
MLSNLLYEINLILILTINITFNKNLSNIVEFFHVFWWTERIDISDYKLKFQPDQTNFQMSTKCLK